MIEKLKTISVDDLYIIKNMMGAFLAKGISVIVSFLILPLYIRFFRDKTVLGLWYTMLSVLNWINLFDLGLGHGLRNKLPIAIENRNTEYTRSLISTTYVLMSLIAGIILIIGEIGITQLNWNKIFNIDNSIVSKTVLINCIRMIFGGVVINIVLKIITSILYALQRSAVVNFLSSIPNIVIVIALCILPSSSSEINLKMISIVNIFALNIPYVICTIIVFKRILQKSVPSLKFFRRNCMKDIFSVGISILWLQLVFMVISSTNEFIISFLTSADYVIEYQAYYKIFNTVGMVFSLSLAPVWSAVTKAQAQGKYDWIRKKYRIFLTMVFICVLVELCMVPIMPYIIRIWIGENIIEINIKYAIIFICSSALFVLHSVNTAIGNGLSYFKIQMIWMTFAAIIFVPLAYILVQKTESWIGVVIANVVALIPYEFLAPIFTFRILGKKINLKVDKEY